MNPFLKFMMNPAGRLARVIVGLILIVWGFAGNGGTLMGVIGFVPLLAGIVNFCLIAPMFGLGFMGKPKHLG